MINQISQPRLKGYRFPRSIISYAVWAYSDAELKTMITEGLRPDRSKMLPPMGYHHYAAMTENDLDAVVLYLRGPKQVLMRKLSGEENHGLL